MELKNYQIRSLDVLAEYFRHYKKEHEADTAFLKVTRNYWERGLSYYDVPELPGLPYLCLRVPTGGGKTLMACHAVGITTRTFLEVDRSVVLWLAPSTTIRDQTYKALSDKKHPYYAAIRERLGAVTILNLEEAKYIQAGVINTDTVVIVSTTQAFFVENPELRKVYEASGALMSHFENIPVSAEVDRYENGKPIPSLGNLLRLHRPIVIVDEAHNVRTKISFETLARFNPACILEFTATPKTAPHPSNVLFSISARELKAESMIKMPIRLQTRPQWKELIGDAKLTLDGLQVIAEKERAETGEYIRPMMLLQAQPRRKNEQTLTVDVVEECLKNDYHIPAEEIARATGEDDQISGEDLSSPDCKIRYIITVQKLREGWDCPFAYVLCSVAEQHSSTAVEQIVGRILRMPNAQNKRASELNMAYAFVSSPNFERTLNELKDALVENGFERQEAEDMLLRQPQTGFGPIFNQSVLGGETIAFNFGEPPAYHKLPTELAKKVKYDAASKVISIPADISEQEIKDIGNSFEIKERSTAFRVAFQNAQARVNVPALTPAEKGVEFTVPVLAFKQGQLFEPFEETHFLDFEWELAKQNAELSEAEFSAERPVPQQGEIDIDDKGEVKTKFLDRLKNQMILLKTDTGWKPSNLVNWLDKNIPHPDIPFSDSVAFLTRVVQTLTEKRNIPFEMLVREKYRLKNAVEAKIDEHRRGAKGKAFQELFGKNSPLTVSPDIVFRFDPEEYPCPVNSLHRGSHQFKKHYYKDIGDLKSSGEEFECAQFIDNMEEVDVWVRNLPRQPKYSFWLQTSTDRFYPDFVARLKNGKTLVVEYKGANIITSLEEQEKLIIGEAWEQRSDGHCFFVMPTNRNFETIRAKVVDAFSK